MGRFIIILAALICGHRAVADEAVQFDAVRYGVGDLQQRLARERGETVERPPSLTLTGYLAKPHGNGPFPAVVYLHGCLGLGDFRRRLAAGQMTDWGYVSFVVDSFATRGISEDCSARLSNRQADALGALVYLSKLPFVDPQRIALIGISQGGTAALEIATARAIQVFEMPADVKFKAVIAFYPSCAAAGNELSAPALILAGGLDDWSPLIDCEWWALRRRGKGAPVKFEVYPEAYHSFDDPGLRVATRYFGHWVKYDPEAAAHATTAMRDFLAAQFK
jgi:dienelactone hydrolase